MAPAPKVEKAEKARGTAQYTKGMREEKALSSRQNKKPIYLLSCQLSISVQQPHAIKIRVRNFKSFIIIIVG